MNDLADDIAMEWKRVPCMPSGEFYDRAWRNILERARSKHGRAAVTAALALIGPRYNGTVPTDDAS